ncbi:pyruvate formate lyase family protein [uncultured Robinsoniella sp.]|uniref:pyruvate formate lyase family protein n=1 Tax=uncultured Robinsoniella sp. TaxID=904190 RepID=UPI00374F2FE5
MFTIMNESMLSTSEKIRVMKEFTDTYRQYETAPAAIREAMCLKVQFPAVMGKMTDEDLFAGRLGAVPVGFNPQEECQQLGYYFDEYHFQKIMDEDISADQKMMMEEMQRFWEDNHTNIKIKKAYSRELNKAIPDKFYPYERAAAYALYRISGTQLNYEYLLDHGIEELCCMLAYKGKGCDEKAAAFYKGMEIALEALQNTCLYYRQMVLKMLEEPIDGERAGHLQELAEALLHISKSKPESFLEAIQLVILYWLQSGSMNLGRMDTYLVSYYTADVDSGRITQERALELLKGMWKALSVRNKPYDTRVVIGGRGRKDVGAADRFCGLAIQATMERMDVVPQLTLRFSNETPEWILKKAFDAIGKGATFPMLYNDEVNIPAVQKAFGVDLLTAQDYCPYGCGEYVIAHQSIGTPSGLINLLKVLEVTLNNGHDIHTGEQLAPEWGGIEDFQTFDELVNVYKKQCEYFLKYLAIQEETEYKIANRECAFLYFSLLYDDCLERGRALLDGGVRYLGGTLEAYGNINTADSLTAIKQLVYEEQSIEPGTLLKALKSNFAGYEEVRRELLDAPKYGNDHDQADAMAQMVHQHICTETAKAGERYTDLHRYLTVTINNNANSVLGKHTAASPDGRLAHTFMANANSPFNGNDKNGLTAMLNSLAKLDPSIHAGCVQNMKFSKQMFSEYGDKVRAMLNVYFQSGGTQAMISVIGREDLEHAMQQPEKYKNLLVRVGGFSARFVELQEEEQREIIARTLY